MINNWHSPEIGSIRHVVEICIWIEFRMEQRCASIHKLIIKQIDWLIDKWPSKHYISGRFVTWIRCEVSECIDSLGVTFHTHTAFSDGSVALLPHLSIYTSTFDNERINIENFEATFLLFIQSIHFQNLLWFDIRGYPSKVDSHCGTEYSTQTTNHIAQLKYRDWWIIRQWSSIQLHARTLSTWVNVCIDAMTILYPDNSVLKYVRTMHICSERRKFAGCSYHFVL